jgi:hypothetical protein
MEGQNTMDVFSVIKWCCAVVFVASVVLTFLVLLGRINIGGNNTERSYYRKRLFYVLIVQIIVASVGAFATDLARNSEFQNLRQQNENLQQQIVRQPGESGSILARDYWARGKAQFDRARKERTENPPRFTAYTDSLSEALVEFEHGQGQVRREEETQGKTRPENIFFDVHIASVKNELGKYQEAEDAIRQIYPSLKAYTFNPETRYWGLAELVLALRFQGGQARAAEAAEIEKQATRERQNLVSYLADQTNLLKQNEEIRNSPKNADAVTPWRKRD